jgi:hypothetical protein
VQNPTKLGGALPEPFVGGHDIRHCTWANFPYAACSKTGNNRCRISPVQRWSGPHADILWLSFSLLRPFNRVIENREQFLNLLAHLDEVFDLHRNLALSKLFLSDSMIFRRTTSDNAVSEKPGSVGHGTLNVI